MRFKSYLIALFALGGALVQAQFRVEVSGSGASQLPIAISTFKFEDSAPQKISAILSADLLRTGSFRVMEGPLGADEQSRPDMGRIRALGAESFVSGSIYKLADGRFDIRLRLWDAAKSSDLGGQNLVVAPSDLRFASHRLADWVYERLTGEKGVAATRIAYITKTNTGMQGSAASRFNLWVADADGDGAASAFVSSQPIISPVWSPSGLQLAYVSFESRKPVVYVHDVPTGQRRIVANFKGSNSSPAWSPDGRQLLVTLSRDGGSQIYLIPTSQPSTSLIEPKRLTSSNSIETEALFAPDGQSIYFVSDRGGSPQIYRMNLQGGAAQRVSFHSNYSISPAISPDGTKLAYISRVSGAFKLVIQDLSTSLVTVLTETTADESPSFSANGRQIMYATQVLTNGRWQEALMTTTIDGRTKSKLSAANGDIREPDWGSYIK